MKMMKIAVSVVLLSGLVFSVPADATVMVEPDNLNISGGIFRFDLVINDPCGVTNADSFQSVINVSGPGTLTLHVDSSQAVQTETNYWLKDENDGATVSDLPVGYRFMDYFSVSATPPEELFAGDIMARYAFTWDTDGDYTFTIDLDSAISFVGLDDLTTKVGLELDPGDDPHIIDSGTDYFTVTIPEPATIMLLGLGGIAVLKNRKQRCQ